MGPCVRRDDGGAARAVRSLSRLRGRVGVGVPLRATASEIKRGRCKTKKSRTRGESPTRLAFARHPPPQAGEGLDHVAAVVTPPSTTMVWPVMKVDASEARYA